MKISSCRSTGCRHNVEQCKIFIFFLFFFSDPIVAQFSTDSYILMVVDDIRGEMDGPYNVDAFSPCAKIRYSFPKRRKTDVAI